MLNVIFVFYLIGLLISFLFFENMVRVVGHGENCFVFPAVVSPGMYYEVGELLKFDIEAYGVYKHVTPGPLLLPRLFRIPFSDLTGGT